jgi:hypothetical protein
MVENAYIIPMAMIRAMGRPKSQPMVKEQAVLMLPTMRITMVRPSLSERTPMEKDAVIPMR